MFLWPARSMVKGRAIIALAGMTETVESWQSDQVRASEDGSTAYHKASRLGASNSSKYGTAMGTALSTVVGSRSNSNAGSTTSLVSGEDLQMCDALPASLPWCSNTFTSRAPHLQALPGSNQGAGSWSRHSRHKAQRQHLRHLSQDQLRSMCAPRETFGHSPQHGSVDANGAHAASVSSTCCCSCSTAA